MLYFLTIIPRLIIKNFHIKHKHQYLYTGSFDGGLAGEVKRYECLWCGDVYLDY